MVAAMLLLVMSCSEEADDSTLVLAVQAFAFAFDFDEVRSHHFLHQVRKARPVPPSEPLSRLAWVAEQAINPVGRK